MNSRPITRSIVLGAAGARAPARRGHRAGRPLDGDGPGSRPSLGVLSLLMLKPFPARGWADGFVALLTPGARSWPSASGSIRSTSWGLAALSLALIWRLARSGVGAGRGRRLPTAGGRVRPALGGLRPVVARPAGRWAGVPVALRVVAGGPRSDARRSRDPVLADRPARVVGGAGGDPPARGQPRAGGPGPRPRSRPGSASTRRPRSGSGGSPSPARRSWPGSASTRPRCSRWSRWRRPWSRRGLAARSADRPVALYGFGLALVAVVLTGGRLGDGDDGHPPPGDGRAGRDRGRRSGCAEVAGLASVLWGLGARLLGRCRPPAGSAGPARGYQPTAARRRPGGRGPRAGGRGGLGPPARARAGPGRRGVRRRSAWRSPRRSVGLSGLIRHEPSGAVRAMIERGRDGGGRLALRGPGLAMGVDGDGVRGAGVDPAGLRGLSVGVRDVRRWATPRRC